MAKVRALDSARYWGAMSPTFASLSEGKKVSTEVRTPCVMDTMSPHTPTTHGCSAWFPRRAPSWVGRRRCWQAVE